jgi:acyl carrier protein
MSTVDRFECEEFIRKKVFLICGRNGFVLDNFNFTLPLLNSALPIDSLDLAEILSDVESEFNVSIFENDSPPSTWNEIVTSIAEG